MGENEAKPLSCTKYYANLDAYHRFIKKECESPKLAYETQWVPPKRAQVLLLSGTLEAMDGALRA